MKDFFDVTNVLIGLLKRRLVDIIRFFSFVAYCLLRAIQERMKKFSRMILLLRRSLLDRIAECLRAFSKGFGIR